MKLLHNPFIIYKLVKCNYSDQSRSSVDDLSFLDSSIKTKKSINPIKSKEITLHLAYCFNKKLLLWSSLLSSFSNLLDHNALDVDKLTIHINIINAFEKVHTVSQQRKDLLDSKLTFYTKDLDSLLDVFDTSKERDTAKTHISGLISLLTTSSQIYLVLPDTERGINDDNIDAAINKIIMLWKEINLSKTIIDFIPKTVSISNPKLVVTDNDHFINITKEDITRRLSNKPVKDKTIKTKPVKDKPVKTKLVKDKKDIAVKPDVIN